MYLRCTAVAHNNMGNNYSYKWNNNNNTNDNQNMVIEKFEVHINTNVKPYWEMKKQILNLQRYES